MFNNLFKPQKITFAADKTGSLKEQKPAQQTQGLGTKIMNFISGFTQPKQKSLVSPVPNPTPQPTTAPPAPMYGPTLGTKVTSTPMPTQAPQPAHVQFVPEEASRRLQAGFNEYLNKSQDQGLSSIHERVPQFVKAAETYPVFKANPYLIPAVSILETSAGRNITRPNNLINWGVRIPENNEMFKKMTQEQVLEIALRRIGKDSPYYEKFRHGKKLTDKEIQDFANIYEPTNASYGPNLIDTIKMFERQQ